MKRRDILKIAPLTVLGLAGRENGSGRPYPLFAPGPAAGIRLAEVRPFNGSPALFLDGKPVFPAINWVSGPRPDSWDFEEQARRSAETGIHIYAFDVGKGTEWVGPGPGRGNDFDFSTVEARFGRVLKADPGALFHLRVYLETGHDDWWEKAHPDECEILSDGRRNGMSFASKVWREQAKEFLRAYIGHFRKTGLSDRVIAYQVGAGHTGEWVKGESSMSTPCGDFSRPMRLYFQDWLRKRYGNDVSNLRTAWHASTVSFDTAAVPGAERQLEARLYTFRDPASEQDVIDYFRALADLCGEAVVDLCRTVKQETGGNRLAGAFYGYLLDLAWNGGFFRERPDSDYSTYQRSGHLGLRRVLASPDVDFLVSPYSYGFRGMGGDSPSMLPADSVRLHGKLLLIEDDTRTHADREDPNYGQVKTLAASRTILRRNLAHFLTHGEGAWWALWKVDPVKVPEFAALLKEFKDVGEGSMTLDRSSASEIAVLIDDESFFYETCRYNLDIPSIFQQRLWGLPRLGAPFDVFLLDDFLSGRLRPYKLHVFLNPFRLDGSRRKALAGELRRDGKVALWIYAPGYLKDGPCLDNMEETDGHPLRLRRTAVGASRPHHGFRTSADQGLEPGPLLGDERQIGAALLRRRPDGPRPGRSRVFAGELPAGIRRQGISRLEIDLQRRPKPPVRCPAQHRPVGGRPFVQRRGRCPVRQQEPPRCPRSRRRPARVQAAEPRPGRVRRVREKGRRPRRRGIRSRPGARIDLSVFPRRRDGLPIPLTREIAPPR